MIRSSIRKSKENSASIEELKNHNHSTSPLGQANNFDMINTLMVVFLPKYQKLLNLDDHDSTTAWRINSDKAVKPTGYGWSYGKI